MKPVGELRGISIGWYFGSGPSCCASMARCLMVQ